MASEIFLDVSELEPPEPMREICKVLASLSQGTVLHVLHRRKPVPLFEMIEEKWCYWHTEIAIDCHHIYICGKNDLLGEEYVRTLLNENDRS